MSLGDRTWLAQGGQSRSLSRTGFRSDRPEGQEKEGPFPAWHGLHSCSLWVRRKHQDYLLFGRTFRLCLGCGGGRRRTWSLSVASLLNLQAPSGLICSVGVLGTSQMGIRMRSTKWGVTRPALFCAGRSLGWFGLLLPWLKAMVTVGSLPRAAEGKHVRRHSKGQPSPKL